MFSGNAFLLQRLPSRQRAPHIFEQLPVLDHNITLHDFIQLFLVKGLFLCLDKLFFGLVQVQMGDLAFRILELVEDLFEAWDLRASDEARGCYSS